MMFTQQVESKINKSANKSIKIHQNPSKSVKIHQKPSKTIKTIKNNQKQ